MPDDTSSPPSSPPTTEAPASSSTTNVTDETPLTRALRDGLTLDASERVCTVDENNIPTEGGHLRSEMRLNKLWHRATFIIIRHILPNDESSVSDYILVQRRSLLKDYCPGKLDPAPGGVVGFGESYEENAHREIAEEMGIDPSSYGGLKKLFTFPYSDERVNFWGELYELTYRGPLSALVIQKEEVDEVLRISLKEIDRQMSDEAMRGDWMPDGLYALRLYRQWEIDRKVRRRLLPGYSSGDLESYGLRPPIKAVFFDCDDCLYFDNWIVANMLTSKIDSWGTSRGLPTGYAYTLYKKHGTALRGLLAEGLIPHTDDAVDDYLHAVHDIPIAAHLSRDDDLRTMILAMRSDVKKFVFTASVSHHAERCLEALGIGDLFEAIIDVKSCGLATKHSREAFEAAMKVAGVTEPEECVFLDDSVKNINAAREMGWRSVLVGRKGRDCGMLVSTEDAEHEIDRIHDLPQIFPELFEN